MPRHFTKCSIGRQVSPMVIPEAEAGFLLDVSRAHFSGQRQRPLDFVKESTMALCSATSSKLLLNQSKTKTSFNYMELDKCHDMLLLSGHTKHCGTGRYRP